MSVGPTKKRPQNRLSLHGGRVLGISPRPPSYMNGQNDRVRALNAAHQDGKDRCSKLTARTEEADEQPGGTPALGGRRGWSGRSTRDRATRKNRAREIVHALSLFGSRFYCFRHAPKRAGFPTARSSASLPVLAKAMSGEPCLADLQTRPGPSQAEPFAQERTALRNCLEWSHPVT